MRHLVALVRALLVTPLLLLAAQACVRLDEPEAFHCTGEADCLEHETCGVRGRCLAADACDDAADCQASQRCWNEKCVPAECVERDTPACGTYRCETSLRTCLKVCNSTYDCSAGNLCDEKLCRPFANRANGNPCQHQEDCFSKACCNLATGRVCAAACTF